MKNIKFILLILVLVSLGGCFGKDPLTKTAGEIHAFSSTFYYSFGIRTVPAGAIVKFNNEAKGATPIRFGMKGPADYLQSSNEIEIYMEGYKTLNIAFDEIDFTEQPPPEHVNDKSMKHFHAELLYNLEKLPTQ